MTTCPAEGVLQSYLDGELSAGITETVAAHVYACAACAVAMNEIKSETAVFDAAFEQTFSAPPPTEKLRARLDAAIAAQTVETIASVEQLPRGGNSPAGWRHAFAAFFALPIARRAAFACVAAVILIGSVLLFIRTPRTAVQVATNKTRVEMFAPTLDAVTAPPEIQSTQSPAASIPARATNNARREVFSSAAKFTRARQTNFERAHDERFAADAAVRYLRPSSATGFLPGEQSYLKAIASLSAALEVNGEKTSSPARVDYKRDLAIVDEAITKTRREALRHPRDTDATEFLLAAYQSKLDLLDTVANASR